MERNYHRRYKVLVCLFQMDTSLIYSFFFATKIQLGRSEKSCQNNSTALFKEKKNDVRFDNCHYVPRKPRINNTSVLHYTVSFTRNHEIKTLY